MAKTVSAAAAAAVGGGGDGGAVGQVAKARALAEELEQRMRQPPGMDG